MIIYKITNKINGNFYIGQTIKSKEERFQRHKYDVSYNSKTHLHSAMRKYGFNNFIIEEIENQIPQEKLNEREIFWIKELNPPYNMTDGGEGCNPLKSPNWIKSMKEHHKNRLRETYASYGMKGKKQSQKFHEAIKESNSNPVSIDGVEYESIKDAMKILGWTEKRVRYRVDSPNYPDCFRLREKTKR
jgi:group I intron endonuclease